MRSEVKKIHDGIDRIHSGIKEITSPNQFPKYSPDFYRTPGIYDHADTNSLNILGISTTYIERAPKNGLLQPFKTRARSTSEDSLIFALEYARRKYSCNPFLVKLRDVDFGFCEGYYSSDKKACEWPCTCTVRDRITNTDNLDVIYYGITEWADIVILSTPIRYNNPSSLYYKMAERLNTVHNHVSLHNRTLIKDKVASFIITGGQDGVQSVAGQLLTFWSEMGFMFPRFSYVGWNRGWYAENTSRNYFETMTNDEFHADLESMVDTAVELKERLNKTSKEYPKYNKEEYYLQKHKNYKDYDPASRRASKKFRR